MKRNKMDIVTDLVKKRMGIAFGEAQKQYKNTNPYRKERIPDEERIMSYTSLMPDVEQELRQQFGDAPVEQMHLNMQKLIERGKIKNAKW